MKLNLISIALILWAGFFALYGQGSPAFGAKAGISMANQSYKFSPIDYTIESEAIVGPSFAIFVETFRGDRFSFQVDVSYALKGSSSATQWVRVNHLDNNRITVNEGEMTTSTFKYLSLSPMVRYRMGQGSAILYFLLGPRLDMLLDYRSESEYPLIRQKRTILGLTVGVGLEYKLRRIGLFAELQSLPDLSPVTNEEPLLINNNMISLTLGIRRADSE